MALGRDFVEVGHARQVRYVDPRFSAAAGIPEFKAAVPVYAQAGDMRQVDRSPGPPFRADGVCLAVQGVILNVPLESQQGGGPGLFFPLGLDNARGQQRVGER